MAMQKNSLLMKSKTRKKLLRMDIVGKIESGYVPKAITSIVLALVGIIFLLIGGISLWSDYGNVILAIICFALGGFFVFLASPLGKGGEKKFGQRVLKDVDRINERHGGLEKAVSEIKQHLHDELPAYTVKTMSGLPPYGSHFHIVGQWFLNLDSYELIHISDIVTIIDCGFGDAKLVLYDGDTRAKILFGGSSEWERVFNLFHEVNPRVTRVE